MADIELLIKIPEEDYKKISNSNPSYADDFNLYYAIKNGKHWDGHTEKDVTRLLSLDQEPILDKIRAEIENDWQLKKYSSSPFSCGLRRAIEIIDKYKAERGCGI